MNPPKIRVRFAPSPTGYLHIGGARTALYNYLLAKKMGGTFILRIEDTDLERSTPESIQAILDGLNWLGLNWDEGPYYQTKRFDLYQEHINKLLQQNKAYPCFCTPEDLDFKRQEAFAQKRKPMYDRTCLKLSKQEIERRIQSGVPHCIRFKSHSEGETIVHDIVKGVVKVPNKELDDLVIRRSDGSPTYNFTVVVDDVTMNITHVIRGDDHLNNTPRQIQMYEALGYPLPQFAHVPMILGADKKRLSKRHGATSVMAYKEMGYLPHALLNYLARLGWSCGDQEIFSLEEMIEKFALQGVSQSAGVFNPEKLLWLNGVYIRNTNPKSLAPLVIPHLNRLGINLELIASKASERGRLHPALPVEGATQAPFLLTEAVKASQEKVKTLEEMARLIDFYFVEIKPDEKLKERFLDESSKSIIKSFADKISRLTQWDNESINKVLEEIMQETGLKLGKVAGPIRAALTGKSISPGIFDVVRILGKEEVIKRLQL